MKFKVGDFVKVKDRILKEKTNFWNYGISLIIDISGPSDVWPILVRSVKQPDKEGAFNEDELEIVTIPNEPITPVVVKTVLPLESPERKMYPIATGVMDYFPSALAEISKISFQGNQQHNPGEPLHWARGKSMDHADTIMRHFIERGTIDPVDGMRHSAKLAWRALALLQLELEAEGAPIARGASYEEKK